MRALVTRPREDAESLVAALAERGMEAVVEPLLEIAPLDGAAPDLEGVQGLLFTSANGVRAFARLSPRRDLAAWCVGDATARCARDMGFSLVFSAAGDVQALADLVKAECKPEAGALLHAAASVRAGDLTALLEQAGYSVRRAVLYEARVAEALSAPTRAALQAKTIDVALFFSPRTASTFVTLAKKAGLDLRPVRAFALSQAVAERLAELGWNSVQVAERPDQQSLLSALDRWVAQEKTVEKDGGVMTQDRDDKVKPEATPETAAPEAAPAPEPAPTDPSAAEPDPADGSVAMDPAAEPFSPQPDHSASGSDKAKPAAGTATLTAAVLGLVVLAALGVGGWWVWKSSQGATGGQAELARALEESQTRMAELEGQIAALRNRPVAASGTGAEVQQVEALAQRLAQIEQARAQAAQQGGANLETLQQQNQALQAEVQRLAQAVDTLQKNAADAATVLRLTERVEQAESTARAMAEQKASAESLLLVLAGLREQVASGRPFADELRAVATVAPETAEVQEALDSLAGQAETGVLTRLELQRGFDEMANDVVRAAVLPIEEGWWQETLRRLGSVVTVRRESGEVAGDSPSAVLARAEGRLTDGNLAAAVRELEQLDGPEAEVAQNWLNDARARLEAERALSALSTLAIAQINQRRG